MSVSASNLPASMPFRTLILLAVITVVVADAHGQFLNLPQYSPGMNFQYSTKADVNNDGKADILGIAQTPAHVSAVTVSLGTGTGGFGSAKYSVITGVDNPSFPFAAADFNGDGRIDAAFLAQDHVTGANVIAVMLGNGDGTFEAPLESTAALPPVFNASNRMTISGDFTGDGKADLAVVVNKDPSTLLVFPGKGDGTFSAPVQTMVSPFPNCLTTGDFNNDGKLDLVMNVPGTTPTGTYLLLGKGDGTFQAPAIIGTHATNCAMAATDLNQDGNLDIVNSNSVFLGNGTGHFTGQTYTSPEGIVIAIAVDDFNNDSHPDIALLTGPQVVTMLLNNGDGTFKLSNHLYNGDQGNLDLFVFMAADVNGDHNQDLVINNGAGGVSILLGSGDGTFKGDWIVPSATATDVRISDFNDDHKPDMMLAPGAVVFLGNGDGTFTPVLGSYPISDLPIGDFNHDGKLDVAGNDSSGKISCYLGNGDGTFTFSSNPDLGIQHLSLLPGDFNNDGNLDLVASDEHGISVLLGDGSGIFQSGIPTGVSASFPTFAVGDFNRDGKLDLAMTNTSGVTVLPGKGNGTFGAALNSSGPTSGLLTVTDLNKDGIPDLLIATGKNLDVLLGKGSGTFAAPVQYSVATTSRPIVADFNADGNLDVAVGSAKGVYIFFGDGKGNLKSPQVFRAGGTVAGIAWSDFNLDGKPDLAVVLGDGLLVTLIHQ